MTSPSTATTEENVSFKPALIVSALFSLFLTALTLWSFFQLSPDTRIPIHWNTAGEIDGWGSRSMLWAIPGFIFLLVPFFYYLPRIEPRRENLLRSAKAYQATWISTIAFFTLLQIATILAALGHQVPMNRWLPVSLGFLFMIMGNYFGKIRSNHFFGIRSPWTLASDLAWQKTHRLGARLFMLFGLVLALLGLFEVPGMWIYGFLLFGVLLLITVVFIHSYRVWKRDPNRRPLRMK